MNRRQKIVVNASTVLISGGFYLSFRIIQALIQTDRFELYVVCPSHKKYSPLASAHTKIILVPRWQLKRIFRLYLDCFWLPRLINKTDPELVYSLCNLPARTNYRQIHLHDNPYVPMQNREQFKQTAGEKILQEIRSKTTLRRFRFVDLLIVQSEFYKKRLQDVHPKIQILTPLAPEPKNDQAIDNPFGPAQGLKNILCLARYYEHKNIEILLDVASLIKTRNLPFVLYITLNRKHHKNVSRILRNIEERELGNVLVNLGQIAYKKITDYIRNCHAMILPSFLESFSLNFIEAWFAGKPLFISNTEANKSACGNAAFYFDPSNAEDILNALLALNHREKVKEMTDRGNVRLSALSKSSDYVRIVKEPEQ